MNNSEQDAFVPVTDPQRVRKIAPRPTKHGRDELWELIDLWDLTPPNKERIKKILDGDTGVAGPHLFRYYNTNPSKVAAAELAMRNLIGTRYCLAVNSGTSSLIAAYRALGIGAGDEVIVPAYTFIATAAAVATANAVPIIVEVDDSLTMDPEAAEQAISRRTKAIVAVHMRGAPAQLDALVDLAKRKGLPLVEDVAQAAGGSFQGKRLGSFGSVGCFSFNDYKIMSSGDGGFVATDNELLMTRAERWHDTAACWRPNGRASLWEEESFAGENYRMTELQGAVAIAQIRKLESVLAGYRRARDLIMSGIERIPGLRFRRLTDPMGDTAICLILFLPNTRATQRAIEALHGQGIPAGGIYDPKIRDWHIFRYWEHILEKRSVARDGLPWSALPEEGLPRYSRDMCPRTLDFLARSIHVEVSYSYGDEDCQYIASSINKALHEVL